MKKGQDIEYKHQICQVSQRSWSSEDQLHLKMPSQCPSQGPHNEEFTDFRYFISIALHGNILSDLCDPNSYQTSYEWRMKRYKNHICNTSFLSQRCHSTIAQNTIHKSWSQWGLAISRSASDNALTPGYIPHPVFIAKISEYRYRIWQVSRRPVIIRRSTASWNTQCPSQGRHNEEFADFRSLTIIVLSISHPNSYRTS